MVQRKVDSIQTNHVSRRKGAMELLRSKVDDLLEKTWACYFQGLTYVTA
jgi:hypothetical protein